MLTSAEQQEAYYKTFGELPTNAAAAKKLQADPALAAIVDSAGEVHRHAVQRRLEPGPAGPGQRRRAVDPRPAAGKVDEAKLKQLIADGQKAAQDALDKSK